MGQNASRKWDTTYVIRMDWIQKLFTRRSWEEQTAGAKILFPPKLFGIRRYNKWWEDGDEEFESDCSSLNRHDDRDWVVRPGNEEQEGGGEG